MQEIFGVGIIVDDAGDVDYEANGLEYDSKAQRSEFCERRLRTSFAM